MISKFLYFNRVVRINNVSYNLITNIAVMNTFFRRSQFSIYVSPVLGLILSSFILVAYTAKAPAKKWVGTWSTAPQLVEQRNMPPAPGLSNNTLRQVVRVSTGGNKLRVKFSNEFSTSPVTIKKVQVAVSKGGSAIDASTIKELKFDGKGEVTMDAGNAIMSDPFSFDLKPRTDVAITIWFGETSPDVTGHPGSRTTSYIAPGDKVSATELTGAVETEHWYVINTIDVESPESSAAVAIIGNSITDGRGSGTNKQNRWPDVLAERLLQSKGTRNVSVLNMGIGGNCVLRSCLGPSALDRLERDIIKQHGVRWLIIMEGVNDIGGTRDSADAARVADGLIDAYDRMIKTAHAENIKVYGATITPIGKSFYYSDAHETARKKVNDWIRNSGRFDAVIDFDKAVQDPEDPMNLLPAANSGDFLHPGEEGYKMMGGAIDLKLFE